MLGKRSGRRNLLEIRFVESKQEHFELPPTKPRSRQSYCDGHEPGPSPFRLFQAVEGAPSSDEDVLHEVVGFFDALQHGDSEGCYGWCVPSEQLFDSGRPFGLARQPDEGLRFSSKRARNGRKHPFLLTLERPEPVHKSDVAHASAGSETARASRPNYTFIGMISQRGRSRRAPAHGQEREQRQNDLRDRLEDRSAFLSENATNSADQRRFSRARLVRLAELHD